MLHNELLKDRPQAFRQLHKLYGFDFENNFIYYEHTGNFTINSLLKNAGNEAGAQLNTADYKVILLVKPFLRWGEQNTNTWYLVDIEENNKPSDFSDIVKSGEEIKSITCTFMFENPVSGKLITGYACNFDGKTFEFNADIPDFVKNLYSGIEIENCSLKTKESTKNVHTIVKQNEENMILELC